MIKQKFTYLLLFIVLITQINIAYSQSKQKIIDAEYNFKNKNYEIALDQYLKIYKRVKNNPVYNYRIGYCYMFVNRDRSKAIPFLEYVDTIPDVPVNSHLLLGIAYFYAKKFDKSKQKINEVIKKYKDKLTPDEIDYAKKHIMWAQTAKELMKHPLNVSFYNIGSTVNTKRDEILPKVASDGTYMAYTTDKKYNSDFQILIYNVYFTYPKPSDYSYWSKGKSAGSAINTDENEFLVNISKDNEKLLVFVDHIGEPGDIVFVNKKGKRYKELEKLGKVINTKYNEWGADLSINEDTLFFASDRPGGYGGYDIYMSRKLPDGSWGLPINLGPQINTKDNEALPTISYVRGFEMYFASDRPQSMGGYDIFYTFYKGGKFVKPKNFGYPINDLYDNLTISFAGNPRYAYVSRVAKDGYGDMDIYKVIFNDRPTPITILTGKLLEGNYYQNKPVSNPEDIEISVTNLKTKEELSSQFRVSKTTERYTITLKPGTYKIGISSPKHEPYSKTITIYDEPVPSYIHKEDIILTPKVEKKTKKY